MHLSKKTLRGRFLRQYRGKKILAPTASKAAPGRLRRLVQLAFLIFTSFSCLQQAGAQRLGQTIRGQVVDADSGQPLVAASLQLLPGELASATDSSGNFRFEGVMPDRYRIRLSYVGYETIDIDGLLLTAGKELVLSLSMRPASTALGAVTVSASRMDIRQLAGPGLQLLTMEETNRFPATFFDPARLALFMPGIVQTNDQGNGMSIRGHSPESVVWRLEGIETVNLNHTANAGTLADGAVRNGGGVNALSAQLLDHAQLYSGLQPVAYGNAVGGQLDMRLREGNNERREYTLQAGVIGLDAAAEGPFRQGGRSSWLFNYRYSFTGLLSALGVPLGDEDIRFQDFSYHLVFPDRSGGKLRLFGVFGSSSNDYAGEADSSSWLVEKDAYAAINFGGRLGTAGLAYQRPLSSRGSLRLTAAWSAMEADRRASSIFSAGEENDQQRERKLSMQAVYRHKIQHDQFIETGTEGLSWREYIYFDRGGSAIGNPFNRYLRNQRGQLGAAFARWQLERRHWQASVGGRLTVASAPLGGRAWLAPRAWLAWLPAQGRQWLLGYGEQQQFTAFPAQLRQLSLSYRQQLPSQLQWQLEAYAQQLRSLEKDGRLDRINGQETADLPSLPAAAAARYYGLEGSLRRRSNDDWHYLVSLSVFGTQYRSDATADWQQGRFSSRFSASAIIGREWVRPAKDQLNRRWGLSMAAQYNGGQRTAPIDPGLSQQLGWTILDTSAGYPLRLTDYYRIDIRWYTQRNKPGKNNTLSIDIQNVTSNNNLAYRYYDRWLQQESRRSQLPLIPVLSYRRTW